MKQIALALLLGLSACAVSTGGPPALKQAQVSYIELVQMDGEFICGATKVAEHTVMTAAHCTTNLMFLVDGQLPQTILLDGHDHALIVVEKPLKGKAAKMSHRLPEIGNKLYLLGKPLGVGPLYREGAFMGTAVQPEGNITWWMTTLLVIGGDSGSGVYDAKGRLVTTVSIGLSGNQFGGGIGFMGFQPYKFTVDQWKEVK